MLPVSSQDCAAIHKYEARSRNACGWEETKLIRVCATGKPVDCYFCGGCGSHVYHVQAIMEDRLIVRTLLLDGGPQMPATGEIFAEGRLGWVKELNESLTNGTS